MSVPRTNVPKFGNWDSEKNVNYTTYFENPRRVLTSDKVNPSNSPDSPNVASKLGAQRASDAARAKHGRRLSQEDGELQRLYDSPSRYDVGRKSSANSSHYRPVGISSDTPKRSAKANGRGFRSADHSPLHPHYQAKIGAKGSTVSSPSWEKKGYEGTHGLAPSTPGRSRLRSVPRGSETVIHYSFLVFS